MGGALKVERRVRPLNVLVAHAEAAVGVGRSDQLLEPAKEVRTIGVEPDTRQATRALRHRPLERK